MPELPEVETIARDLKPLIVGQKIDQIFVLKEKSFIGDARYLIGHKICGISRCGKMIVLELTNKIFLAIHLKMTGQLIYKLKSKKRKSKNCRRSSGQSLSKADPASPQIHSCLVFVRLWRQIVF